MSPIASLVRLRQWTVDERRRELADLLRQDEELHRRIDAIEREVADEAATAVTLGPIAVGAFAAYAERMAGRRRELEAEAAGVQHRVAAARERLRAAFGDGKAAELVRDRIEAQEAADEKRREQARLDEIGIERYRRAPGRGA